MKTSHDPRHLERIKTMQQIFAWDFTKNQMSEGEGEIGGTAKNILENLEEIDKLIQDSAPSWPLDKINKIDLAVLRLAVYELFIGKTAPTKVIVDEAVEIAKSYGAESSGSFINGALGKMIKENNISVS